MKNYNIIIGARVDFIGNVEVGAFNGEVENVTENDIDGVVVSLRDMEDNVYDVALYEIDGYENYKTELRVVSITTEYQASFIRTNANDETIRQAISYSNNICDETDEYGCYFEDIIDFIERKGLMIKHIKIKDFDGDKR